MFFPSANIARSLASRRAVLGTDPSTSLRAGSRGARPRTRSSENSHLLSYSPQHFDRLLQFFFRVRGGHDGAHARFAFGDGGEGDAGSEYSFFEKLAGKIHSESSVANDDWSDRRFAGGSGLAADVEAEQAEFFLPEARVRPELLHPLRLSFENIESRNAGRRDGGRMRSRKQEGTRAVIKIVDQIARAADVST